MGIPEVEQVEHVGEKVDLIVNGAECVQSEVCCRRRLHHQTSCKRDELVADAEDCCKGSTEPHGIDLLGPRAVWRTGYGARDGATRHQRSMALSTSRAVVVDAVIIIVRVRVRFRVHNPPSLARARGR